MAGCKLFAYNDLRRYDLMAITNWWTNETPMPSVARVTGEQLDQPDQPPVAKGFGEASSYAIRPQSTDGAAIDRRVRPARVPSSDGGGNHSSDPGDRFPDVSRHIL
jgi:hypothetical protein